MDAANQDKVWNWKLRDVLLGLSTFLSNQKFYSFWKLQIYLTFWVWVSSHFRILPRSSRIFHWPERESNMSYPDRWYKALSTWLTGDPEFSDFSLKSYAKNIAFLPNSVIPYLCWWATQISQEPEMLGKRENVFRFDPIAFSSWNIDVTRDSSFEITELCNSTIL